MSFLAQLVFKYKKTIIIIWSVILLSFSYYALQLPSILQGSGFRTEGQFEEVENILKEEFNIPESNLILLFEKRTPDITDERFLNHIEQTVKQLSSIESIAQIVSPLDDNRMLKENAAYALLLFNYHYDEMKDPIKQVRSHVYSTEDIFVGLTGGPIINEDMSVASQKDLIRAELIGIPIALVVLLLAFGGLVAASIPIMIGFVTVISSMGIIFLTGQSLSLSIFILNVIPMIGLALGIDFALLLVNRFREEILHSSIQDAISTALLTAGRSILFSGVCVLLGLSGLLFIQVDIFRTIAFGGIIVVFLSVLSAITLLPALLVLLGRHINRFMVIPVKENQQASIWNAFSKFIMRHPIGMSVIGFTLLAIAIVPIKDIELTIPDANALPAHYESRITFEKFENYFIPKDRSKVVMVIEGEKHFDNNNQLHELFNFITELEEDKLVSEVESIFSYITDGIEEFLFLLQSPEHRTTIEPLMERYIYQNRTMIEVTIEADDHSPIAMDWVREWERKEHEYQIRVGGYAKFHQEIFDEIFSKLPYVLSVVLVSTFIVLLFAYQSVLIPLKAILMNVASLGASFGILVWLFQGGHLGLEQASIALMIPVLIFGIVFGLSMDYEVFLISRIHEIYQKTKNNDQATLEGLTTTSKIITSAAAIIIVITGAFAFTGVVPVKQIGIGIALAIFIDATIVRMILVPSLMKLLGDWNWWAPHWFKKMLRG